MLIYLIAWFLTSSNRNIFLMTNFIFVYKKRFSTFVFHQTYHLTYKNNSIDLKIGFFI